MKRRFHLLYKLTKHETGGHSSFAYQVFITFLTATTNHFDLKTFNIQDLIITSLTMFCFKNEN